ncbi:MAG: 23S rRNA (guanosine(2251)-2'-O)-methyltransferase RlmB [Clostridia bacterium]|jgi:23S rRNA (guanosine2251-2'-O)-methyltransferase|nr:23S rRNA (guanosine(2251)-2'-O)-methyltransferase RlmB [Clostridia bacterium]
MNEKTYKNKSFNKEKSFNVEAEISANVVCGRNAVLELLRSGRSVDKIFVKKELEGALLVIQGEARSRGVPIIEVKHEKLDELSCGIMHQGVVALAAEKDYVEIADILAIAREKGEKPFVVIADGINDPHNLGALIRCADGAGVHGVILPKRHSAPLSPVVSRSSAGAVEHMPIAKVTNLTAAIKELKEEGLWVVGCEADGQLYDEIDFDMPLAVVLGSEGEGISDLVRRNCDFIASIPMLGRVNSLNVSCAAAIILFEAARSRRIKK